MWLHVLLLWLYTTHASYVLVDLAYKEPECFVNVSNRLGEIEIRNNLIGDEIRFVVNFSRATSRLCVFCAQNTSQCDTPIWYHIAPLYRLKLLAFDVNMSDRLVDYHLRLFSNEAGEVKWKLAIPQCGETFHFVLVLELLLLVNESNSRNISLYATPTHNETTRDCNSSLLYDKLGFDCLAQPFIHPLRYTLNRCLLKESHTVTATRNLTLQNHSALYWYNRSLYEPTDEDEHICGTPLRELLYTSNLYLSQCASSSHVTHTTLRPWYRVALALILWRLNGHAWYEQSVMLYALDLLERHCMMRESIELTEQTRLLIESLEALNVIVQEDRDVMCGALREHFDTHYNETITARYYKQWYYEVFKYVVQPGHAMNQRVTLFLAFLSTIPFLLLVSISVFYLYRYRTTKKKTVKV